MRNLWILEAVTDRRSLNIVILWNLWSNSLKNTCEGVKKYIKYLFSKATGNSPKVLLKMNSFTNILQGFQTANLS